jgi:hypothetical protein
MNKYAPECPFCGKYIPAPEKMRTEFGEIIAGRCGCGAVYVCDPTGHNLGEAYSDALAFAKGDWDIYSLSPDADYRMIDMDYDLKKHARLYSKSTGEGGGKLIFVKLSDNTAGREPQGAGQNREAETETAPVKPEKCLSKNRLREMLDRGSYDEIASAALGDKGIIRRLISSSYDKDDVISWRAMEALGFVAGRLSRSGKTEIVRDTIRRLLWSMGEESGGIGWSAAEMLGEIIRSNPGEFSDIIPIVWSFREEDMFRAGVARAMGRIAEVRSDLVNFITNDIREIIRDKDPAVRGYAAWAVGLLGDERILEELRGLSGDKAVMKFYLNGELSERAVGEIAFEAINKNK